MKCNILIKPYARDKTYRMNLGNEASYRIPDCDVPPGEYATGKPKNALDASRITVHDFAWRFFDPTRERLNEFEGTDYDVEKGTVTVYIMDTVPPDKLEGLVTALAEEFTMEACLPAWMQSK